VYCLTEGRYQRQAANLNGRYLLAGLGLQLGVWSGKKGHRTSRWLRWWDQAGVLLPWGAERMEQQRQEKELAQQQVERLTRYRRDQGLDPDLA